MTALAQEAVDVTRHAKFCGITQKVFVSKALWDQYIILPPDTKRIDEQDPRLMVLLWQVRRDMPIHPEHRDAPCVFESEVKIQTGTRLIEHLFATVTIDGETMTIRMKGEEG